VLGRKEVNNLRHKKESVRARTRKVCSWRGAANKAEKSCKKKASKISKHRLESLPVLKKAGRKWIKTKEGKDQAVPGTKNYVNEKGRKNKLIINLASRVKRNLNKEETTHPLKNTPQRTFFQNCAKKKRRTVGETNYHDKDPVNRKPRTIQGGEELSASTVRLMKGKKATLQKVKTFWRAVQGGTTEKAPREEKKKEKNQSKYENRDGGE